MPASIYLSINLSIHTHVIYMRSCTGLDAGGVATVAPIGAPPDPPRRACFYLYTYLSIYLSIYLYTYRSIYISIYVDIYLHTYLYALL